MICKECGAFNPDHASYCKVCAAKLKDDVETETSPVETNETTEHARPTRGFASTPVWAKTRQSADVASDGEQRYDSKPYDPDLEDDASDVAAEEPSNAKSAALPLENEAQTERWSRPAKREEPIESEEDDVIETEEDEPVEEPEEEPVKPAPKRRFGAFAAKHASDEDEDEDDEDDDEDEDDEEEYEYEPTVPRKQKSEGGGSGKLFWILLAAIIVVLAVLVTVVIYYNVKDPAALDSVPFLRFNCAGTSTDDANASASPSVAPSSSADVIVPDDAVNEASLTEGVNESGEPIVTIGLYLQPGETATIAFDSQDDSIITNDGTSAQTYDMKIPKVLYYPNMPLDNAEYVVTPVITVADAAGSTRELKVPSFTLTFETVSLTLSVPESTEAPIMASAENIVPIAGVVNDHTVSVYIDDQAVTVYEGGNFQYDFTMTETSDKVVTIRAEKDNYVTSELSFTVTPYVYVPETMELSVMDSDASAMRADSNGKLTVSGIATLGATIVPSTTSSGVVFGSVTQSADGTYTFDATFEKDFYGAATVTISASKEGYTDASVTCMILRGFSDYKTMIKVLPYHEVGSTGKVGMTYAELTANCVSTDSYRVRAKIEEVLTDENGNTIIRMSLLKSGETIYVMNMSAKWEPSSNVGKSYRVYCIGNGLYTTTGDAPMQYPYLIAWFALSN